MNELKAGTITLIAAIRAANLAAAMDLIRLGVDVNQLAPDGLTPLMIASGLGQSQMVDLLLTAGAQVLTQDPRAGRRRCTRQHYQAIPTWWGCCLIAVPSSISSLLFSGIRR